MVVNMEIRKSLFGKTKDGSDIHLFTLKNKDMTVTLTNYGGIVTSVLVPDQKGKIDDVVLGFNNLDSYLKTHPFFGALVGRYGNRIGNSKFTLEGKEYKLVANDGKNHLHGGTIGFDKVVWKAAEVRESGRVGIRLQYLSVDGEEGYPGNLNVTVYYFLTEENELVIEYEAETDKTTVVNLTHHSYFNLAGEGSGDVLSHEVMINADRITAVDDSSIPTGELAPVKGTAFDFTSVHAIGERIASTGNGYDHNYCINRAEEGLVLAARIKDPSSGRVLEVSTTEPGVQFYSGNYLDGSLVGKAGKPYQKRSGFCFETQHYPDSPNQPSFPSTVLKSGEIYRHTCVYKFIW